ncbi:MAG: CHAT domain-containing protein [Acidobacteriota bacterium]|nr:CHAT domain-containing protein [Acidobacteriota bacterium]
MDNFIGDLGEALSNLEAARKFYHQSGQLSSEATAIKSEGWAYNNFGDYKNAIDRFSKALVLYNKANDEDGAAGAAGNLGQAYISINKNEEAIVYLKQSLAYREKTKDWYNVAGSHNLLGRAYLNLKNYPEALSHLNKAFPVFMKVSGNPNYTAYSLSYVGELYAEQKNFPEALKYFQLALSFAKRSTDLSCLANIYNNLMETYAETSPFVAVAYGKQSVYSYQKYRAGLKSLTKEQQRIFLKTVERTYRHLASLLIHQERFPEAQAVLDLLKDEEYEQLTRGSEKGDTIPYSQTEANVIAKIENLVALERQRSELQKLQNPSEEQLNKLEQLRQDIAAANKAFDNALEALGKVEQSAHTRVDEIKNGQELQSALQSLGKETKSGVVALYTVLGTEEKGENSDAKKAKSKFGWVIMVTEKGYKAYPIDVTDLEETVFKFRGVLSSDKYDPRPLAEKIYNAIFRQTSPKLKRTLEEDLREYLGPYKDKTLMWSLDGVLRYIPMAALHDGRQYLVEGYRNVVFTRQSFLWLTKENQPGLRALGLGVSEGREGFTPLGGVKTELETIIREPNSNTGILNGAIRLNDNFKKRSFFNEVESGSYPVVHIASHYRFIPDPEKQDASFLLVGDGHLTFSEMKEEKNLFGAVDLLTLSACDTGVAGNGKEAEGFAYLAQSLGAKSVIASLWKVSDAGTPELMVRFYRLRTADPKLPKGEAFREAQLELLRGESGSTGVQNVVRSKVVPTSQNSDQPLFKPDPKAPFAPPYYWASFILIGNWK